MEARLISSFEAAAKDKSVPGIGAMLVNSKGEVLFETSHGTLNLDDPASPRFTKDTMLHVFSCTKLLTSIAALQLYEQGMLSLSDPVEKYVPRIAKIQVIESMSADGPILRTPKFKPTILQLLTHTAGFSYDSFDPLTLQYRMYTGRKPGGYSAPSEYKDFETPYIADPGTKYVYGVNTDWMGFVIEAITGQNLAEYLDQNVLKPLGMHNTGPVPDPSKPTLVIHIPVHGKLVAVPASKPTDKPGVHGGGSFLYSTLEDYAKLLATMLNNGTSPSTGEAILKPETVEHYLFTDQLPPKVDRSQLGEISTAVPLDCAEGGFFPSLPLSSRGWSCGLLLNHEDLPFGRKKGSGGWAGLGNLYYWIDPTANVAGIIGTGTLPFMNPTVLKLFDELERVAYGHEPAGDKADPRTMNHRVGPPLDSDRAKM
ncbi:hypothetical protein PV08_02549 [Exophiala spinifera]|uniref:Beta-lactamase-related domain-containing protein n=1 Tax=Exophiala spinifera TaxID=91928 RepID=A0A0D1YSL8_9EURO|nr:uncharacterized protein PV08_02549 [Exophiala spinifera]KIW18261.1 hypothetical protein PV08_02549 [Exophiala spinifera]